MSFLRTLAGSFAAGWSTDLNYVSRKFSAAETVTRQRMIETFAGLGKLSFIVVTLAGLGLATFGIAWGFWQIGAVLR